MRAILCDGFDGPDSLRIGDAPDPRPAPGQAVIAVKAASVTFMDALMVSGGYQLRPETPFSPGTDAAGVVVDVGEGVTRVKVGDRVAATGWHGAWAERMVADQGRCTRLPDALDFPVAATVLHNYLTAHYAFARRLALKAGETLCVTGAAGGVGLAAVDMGRAMGARVIAVARGAEKAALLRSYGADAVIDPQAEDLRARIKDLTEGAGVDVCFETIGGDMFLTMGRLMAWGGRIAPIGFASGDIPALPMNLPLLKGYSVVGVFAGVWQERAPDDAAAAADAVMAQAGAGALRPHVDRILPLAQAAEAIGLVTRRRAMGRVVLEI